MRHNKGLLMSSPGCPRKAGIGCKTANSRGLWLASFLALALVFSLGFLDQSLNKGLTWPWILATQLQADATTDTWNTYADERPQCVSKAQHSLYLTPSRLFPMSAKLLARLRQYEEMHRRCTLDRDWDAEILVPWRNQSDCLYLFFVENGGLGNRFLGAMSAFVYSVLTNRAMLMGRNSNMSHLICNPFETSDWLVPLKFPHWRLNRLQVPLEDSSVQDLSNTTVVKLKQQHGQKVNDRRFYCTWTQHKLSTVKWVTFDSNQYMIPRFFIMPYFWPQMLHLFGDDPSHVFTHLSRYMLLPRNFIWDRILRIYWSYLSDAGKRVGVQIRRHSTNFLFDQGAYDRVMNCLVHNQLVANTTEVVPVNKLTRMEPRPVFNLTNTLHRLSEQLRASVGGSNPISLLSRSLAGSSGSSSSPENVAADSVERGRPVSVLIASLNPEYYEEMKRQYSNNPTADGSIVRVMQVTSDKSQSYDFAQLVDACTEMWLLALSDQIATSGWSTFGYIGHGIGGLEPYIVDLKGNRHKPTDQPCWRSSSSEPCCHFPFLDSVCIDSVTNATESDIQPELAAWAKQHLRHCVDEKRGIQLVSHVSQDDFPLDLG